jgi:hypothetical protein
MSRNIQNAFMVVLRVDDRSRLRAALRVINKLFFLLFDYRCLAQSLTNDEHIGFREAMRRHFEIKRCRAFSDPTAGIVVGTVARTVVTAKVTRVGDRYASQMCANTQDYQPLGILRADIVLLWITKRRDVHFGLCLDLRVSPVNFT